jgi:transglutaminase-like putative cysteine protease
MKLAIHTALDYLFPAPSDVLLQIEAAVIPEQRIEAAHIAISPTEHFARVAGHDTIGDRIWLQLQGRLTVDYTATVEIDRLFGDLAALPAVPTHLLPGETVEYLMPSRYCHSDRFRNFVQARFAGLAGGARIVAIRDWIHSHVAYVPGASDAATGALETFVTRQGVCRDFAHMMITLVRASAIPARFASVYAPNVVPQDFHAAAEVFLAGAWYLVDATGMASGEDIAKIGVGRDAADTSFLTSYGPARLNRQTVEVSVV